MKEFFLTFLFLCVASVVVISSVKIYKRSVNKKIRAIEHEITEIKKIIEQEQHEDVRRKEQRKSDKKQDNSVREQSSLKAWAKKSGKVGEFINVKKRYGGRIKLATREHCFSYQNIIAAIIVLESGGNPRAVSKNGKDFGLMQLQKRTAMSLGRINVFHPYENIWGGTAYLKKLYKQFKDLNTALAAYNIGPTKVRKLIKNGFNPDNYHYVQKVRFLSMCYI